VGQDVPSSTPTGSAINLTKRGHVHAVGSLAAGAGTSHGHAFTGSATSVVQPYIVVHMWKRTA
jgi:hypothetical protein